MGHKSEKYRFAKEKQITCLGMDIESGNLYEWIGDHTKKILQEQESHFIWIDPEVGITTENVEQAIMMLNHV